MQDPDATRGESLAAPAGCESTQSHERKFTATAEYCERLARELTEPKPATPRRGSKAKPKAKAKRKAKDRDLNAIVKLMDAAIKARRAASFLARVREQDAEAMRVEALEAEMARGGSH